MVDYAYTDAGEVMGETITLPSGERFGAGTLQDEDAGVLADCVADRAGGSAGGAFGLCWSGRDGVSALVSSWSGRLACT